MTLKASDERTRVEQTPAPAKPEFGPKQDLRVKFMQNIVQNARVNQ